MKAGMDEALRSTEHKVKRLIRVVLPTGEQIAYFPTHVPVNKQEGAIPVYVWEEDAAIFSLAINLDNVVVVEMVTRRADQEQETLDLIEQAKAREADEGGG